MSVKKLPLSEDGKLGPPVSDKKWLLFPEGQLGPLMSDKKCSLFGFILTFEGIGAPWYDKL